MAVTRASLAQLYSSLTGLDYNVALGQLNAENSKAGRGTNPLGVRCGNSKGSGLEIGCDRGFAVYRSSSDGIRAAAWLLLNGSRYGAVRQAITTGTPASQRLALIRSGWAAGGYSGGAGFPTAGITGSAPSTVGPPPVLSRQPSVRLASSPTGGAGTVYSYLVAAGKQVDPSQPLDTATITVLKGVVSGDRQFQPWNRAWPAIAVGLLPYMRKPISQVPFRAAAPDLLPGSSFNPPPQAGFGDLFGWVPGTLANVAVLATVLVLGYLGVRKLVG